MKLMWEWICFIIFNVVCLYVLYNMWDWLQLIETRYVEIIALFGFTFFAFAYALITVTWIMGDDDE